MRTEISVASHDATDEGIFYFQDHVHWPEPLSPLFGSYFPSISRRASMKAAKCLAMPFPPPRPRIVNHYFYLGFVLPQAASPGTQRLLDDHQRAVNRGAHGAPARVGREHLSSSCEGQPTAPWGERSFGRVFSKILKTSSF